ncbi:stage III sporulation protein AF [Bacillus timonensis]|nr:stage III sporulation protein AF [Bacillus timonensis]
MNFITEWITNIILFILLATIIDMLLPNSNMQKYVKMVTGLLLIVIILTPLFNFLSSDFEQAFATINLSPKNEEKKMENLIEMKKKEIQASNRAYILEEMAVQMKTQVEEELMNKYGLILTNVILSLNDEDSEDMSIENMSIQVNVTTEEVHSNEIPAVKLVTIDTSKDINRTSNNKNDEYKEISSFLAKHWEADPNKIVVNVEGGEE